MKTTARHVGPQLAKQVSKNLREHRALTSKPGIPIDRVWALADRLAALEAEAEFHPSGDGAGMLLKLGVLNLVVENLPFDPDTNTEKQFRRIGRLVEQLKSDIEMLTGADAGALGFNGAYFNAGREAANDDVAA